MARQPRNNNRHHRRPTHEMLVDTFFGSFARAMTTFAILFGIFAAVFPDRAQLALANVVGVIVLTVGPVIPSLMALIFVCWILWLMVKNVFK